MIASSSISGHASCGETHGTAAWTAVPIAGIALAPVGFSLGALGTFEGVDIKIGVTIE